jgi:hypothetical protein
VQIATPLIIPAGQYFSNGVDLAGVQILRLVTPPNWLGKGAAVTFQLSEDGATWSDLLHAETSLNGYVGYEVVARLAADASLTMPVDTGQGISWLRVRSGTRGMPVRVPADMTFAIIQEAVAG